MNNNLTTGKSFSKFLLSPKRKYFCNKFREKSCKKLLSSTEDRPIFKNLEGSRPRVRLQKLSSRKSSRPTPLANGSIIC